MKQPKITLQTKGVLLAVKEKAEERAEQEGFTSFQEVIRLFTNLYANEGFPMQVSWGAANDPEVKKSLKEYKQGKGLRLKKGVNFSTQIG